MDFNEMFPSRFLKATEFKEPLTATIKSVTIEEIGEEREQKPVLWVNESPKGLVLNKTNGAILAAAFGVNTDSWVGKAVRLVVENVPFRGKLTPSLRVKTDACTLPVRSMQAVPRTSVAAPVAAAAEIGPGEGEDGFTITGVKQPKAGIFIIEAYCTGMGESSGTLFRTTNKDWALAAKGMIGKEGPVDIGWKTAADNVREVTKLDTTIPF